MQGEQRWNKKMLHTHICIKCQEIHKQKCNLYVIIISNECVAQIERTDIHHLIQYIDFILFNKESFIHCNVNSITIMCDMFKLLLLNKFFISTKEQQQQQSHRSIGEGKKNIFFFIRNISEYESICISTISYWIDT